MAPPGGQAGAEQPTLGVIWDRLCTRPYSDLREFRAALVQVAQSAMRFFKPGTQVRTALLSCCGCHTAVTKSNTW